MPSFLTQKSQILYNDLQKAIESLDHSQPCLFTLPLAAFCAPNTLSKFFALTFLPGGFLFP